MNNLNKNLAPISDKAWEILNFRTKEILTKIISARKVITLKNIGSSRGIATGNLNIKKLENLEYGVYEYIPLIETRFNFTLNRWELDNAERGNDNINLNNLDEAIFKAAKFEEELIYNGLDDIRGLISSCKNPSIKLGDTSKEILTNLSRAMIILRDNYISEKLDLVVNYNTWIKLNSIESLVPLIERIENLINGNVIVSKFIPNSILIPHKSENFELAIGNDFSIGYQNHTSRDITFFITESFTFKVIDVNSFVVFE